MLRIINNRACPVTVNWEVTNCDGCPNPVTCQYCNSLAYVGSSPPYIIIGAGTTYVIDISTQISGTGAADCTWYGAATIGYDVFVGLIEINGMGAGTFGGVSCGCSVLPYRCFSSSPTAGGGSTNIGPPSCSAIWSMTWANTPTGITVTIN